MRAGASLRADQASQYRACETGEQRNATIRRILPFRLRQQMRRSDMGPAIRNLA